MKFSKNLEINDRKVCQHHKSLAFVFVWAFLFNIIYTYLKKIEPVRNNKFCKCELLIFVDVF